MSGALRHHNRGTSERRRGRLNELFVGCAMRTIIDLGAHGAPYKKTKQKQHISLKETPT